MELRLTNEETDALALVLRSYISELRMEVADTDRKRFRDALKERERILRDLLERIEPAAVPAATWPYEPGPEVDSEA